MTWIASETQNVEIASYDNSNCEFDGVYTYRAIEGCGLPPRACFDIPEQRVGFAAVRNADDSDWDYVEDHRGDTVYSTETGIEQTVSGLGPYSHDVTPLKPATSHDKWDGSKWVTDAASQKAEQVSQADTVKSSLQREAEDAIKPLERAKSLSIATPQELAILTEWEKYTVYLMRVDTSTAPNITWPVKPAAV
ncbi:MAG: tail fiber assembly protein [Plesiomonas shigelloides]